VRSIHAEKHRPQIEALLRSVGLSKFELVVAESVQAWAQSVGIKNDNSDRTGMAATRSDGVALVVLRSRITRDQQQSVKDGMLVRGFGAELDRLDAPEAFLEHLVLHEAAHLLLDGASKSDCDEWAFDRLAGAIRPVTPARGR